MVVNAYNEYEILHNGVHGVHDFSALDIAVTCLFRCVFVYAYVRASVHKDLPCPGRNFVML